jgi:hypothetical protein
MPLVVASGCIEFATWFWLVAVTSSNARLFNLHTYISYSRHIQAYPSSQYGSVHHLTFSPSGKLMINDDRADKS